MTPFNFLSPNADNLFKFLFINGLLMIVLGMFYPLQKRDEIELKILEYNKQIELLSKEINALTDDIEALNTIVWSRINLSNSLTKKRDNSKSLLEINKINSELDEMKLQSSISYQIIKKNQNESFKNDLILKNERVIIQELKNQAASYKLYCNWLLGIGISLSIIGFICWTFSTYMAETKNYSEFMIGYRNKKRIRRRLQSILKTTANQNTNP